MSRFPRTATNIIAAITAAAWLIAVVLGESERAAFALGFIPARFSLAATPFPAVPAWLTPLTATLVHSGLVHLGFNLLIFVWCGSAVERVLGMTGLILLYLVGAFAAAFAQWAVDPAGTVPMVGASGAISAVMGAFAQSVHQQPAGQPLDQRRLADDRLGRAADDDEMARRRRRLSARGARACRRVRGRPFAAAAAAAVALPQGMTARWRAVSAG